LVAPVLARSPAHVRQLEHVIQNESEPLGLLLRLAFRAETEPVRKPSFTSARFTAVRHPARRRLPRRPANSVVPARECPPCRLPAAREWQLVITFRPLRQGLRHAAPQRCDPGAGRTRRACMDPWVRNDEPPATGASRYQHASLERRAIAAGGGDIADSVVQRAVPT
jgi:hypothetical protein